MKKLMILTALVGLTLTSCGSGSGSMKTEQDSVAYAIGLDLGNYIKSLDSTLNVNTIASGMKDAIAGKEKINKDTAYNFLREVFTVRKPAREKEASAKFLADVEKNNKNIKKSASGLLYEVIEQGDATRAAMTDRVRVVYTGTLKSGKVFDSSVERNDTTEFALNQVIPGWSEGLTYIGKGGKIKLWIPSDLAYGEQAPPQIGANQALMFDVEVIDIIPVDTTAKPAAPVMPTTRPATPKTR